MRGLNLPPQITRLLLVTVGIVGSYLVARYFLTPPSFGEYGFFRGDALQEQAARPIVFAGKKACDECHSDILKVLGKAEHKTLSCEGCHGAASAHAEDPESDKKKPDKREAVACLRCHEASPSRPKWLKQISSKSHYGTSQKCIECHKPHQPNEVP